MTSTYIIYLHLQLLYYIYIYLNLWHETNFLKGQTLGLGFTRIWLNSLRKSQQFFTSFQKNDKGRAPANLFKEAGSIKSQ